MSDGPDAERGGRSTQQLFRRKESLASRVENPFHNPAPWTKYEVLKAVLLGPTLFPIRFVLLILILLLELLIAKLATVGFPFVNDRGCLYHKQPLALWRRLLLAPVAVTNRILLWCLGFWRIRITDRRKDKSIRPNILVVAPHQCFVDPFIMAYAFPPMPGAVGKKELLSIPLMQSLYIAGQGIFVDRKNANSRHACKDAIAFRADPGQWTGPPTMIFPEGTTTNGKVLVQYKLGPFCPGQPVQPVLLTYPNRHFDTSWVGQNANMGKLFIRMMLQFANRAEVEILDPYIPSQAEREDAKLFAQNVRQAMAGRLGIGTTEHTYEDVFLSEHATRFNVGADFQVNELTERYGLTYKQMESWLRGFHEMDKDKDGTLSYEDFAKVISQVNTTLSQEALDNLFAFFDTDHTGSVEYCEFVQVMALLYGNCSMESRTQLAFLILDSHGTGKVPREKLRKTLNLSVGHTSAARSVGTDDEASPAHAILGQADSEAARGSEEVTYEEFCALVQKHPEALEKALGVARTKLGILVETN